MVGHKLRYTAGRSQERTSRSCLVHLQHNSLAQLLAFDLCLCFCFCLCLCLDFYFAFAVAFALSFCLCCCFCSCFCFWLCFCHRFSAFTCRFQPCRSTNCCWQYQFVKAYGALGPYLVAVGFSPHRALGKIPRCTACVGLRFAKCLPISTMHS